MAEKITLVTTVKNEEAHILSFLESIASQTKRPDEIVIVDAYSTDNTYSLIKKFPLKITLFRKKGNRAIGRNTAIKKSGGSVIAVSDVGCVLDRYWLERITKPFENLSVYVVAGFYKPKTNGVFQRCLSTYTCTMPDKLNKKKFLPSSRSIAFRKKAWESVGGYPENLDTCEDLMFDKKLKKSGMRFVTVSNAIVFWPQRKNIFEAMKQFYLYANGDGKARFIRRTIPFLYGRYILGIFILVFIYLTRTYELFALVILLVMVYMTWSIQKNFRYVRNWKGYIYLPLLQLTSDICVLTGTTLGFIKSYEKK